LYGKQEPNDREDHSRKPSSNLMLLFLIFCVTYLILFNVSGIVCVTLCAVLYLSVLCYFVSYVYLCFVSYCSNTATGRNPICSYNNINNNYNNFVSASYTNILNFAKLSKDINNYEVIFKFTKSFQPH
jgi:hypothetical protein